jgi:hypothetical protein
VTVIIARPANRPGKSYVCRAPLVAARS